MIKGSVVTSGYFWNEELTNEIIKDGWLYTGDIGEILKGNQLKIIDWKKNLFKLSQGEYIAPEKLEGIYSRHHLVD